MSSKLPLAFRRHDHAGCRRAALKAAECTCARRGLRLTASRRRVLEILLEEHTALGAYEILDRLAGETSRPQPPVAYRALDFLVTNGLAHRVERLNAYVACAHPGKAHSPALMVCKSCRTVAELLSDADAGPLAATAGRAGFRTERMVMELEGLCAACQAGA